MKHDIRSLALANKGKDRIEWAGQSMPVVLSIRKNFSRTKPLKGVRIGACLHVTSETANLMITLKEGGAHVSLCASNPLSTQDEVAASLVKHYGIPVFAVNGENAKRYYRHIQSVLATNPQVTMDDGADLISTLHRTRDPRPETRDSIWGSTEETTIGVIRLKNLEKEGKLQFPIIAVNEAQTKHLFDNRYGTGQSTLDGIIRATNHLIAGQIFVVAGYGWCGKGVAMRAKGLGAQVIVTEVEPLRALEAVMDGFSVKTMAEAAPIGNIFVTLTGDRDVIRKEHFLKMKDGAILANSGHFDIEIDIAALKKLSRKTQRIRSFVDEYILQNRKKIYVLAEGRLVNLAAAEGHPASVMDLSFANQSLSAEYIARHHDNLGRKVYAVPEPIDREIARLKLEAMQISIDQLTPVQKGYLESWQLGT